VLVKSANEPSSDGAEPNDHDPSFARGHGAILAGRADRVVDELDRPVEGVSGRLTVLPSGLRAGDEPTGEGE
jgi:hypothetical protein